jgi:hypothetical protein
VSYRLSQRAEIHIVSLLWSVASRPVPRIANLDPVADSLRHGLEHRYQSHVVETRGGRPCGPHSPRTIHRQAGHDC